MKKNYLYLLVLTSIFSALVYAGTWIHIPMPSGGIVHLGNFVMVIAALLCGPIVGGISGSLGMGLFDITAAYGPSSILRSFILKFIIGFLVGFIFRLIIKKQSNIKVYLLVFSIIFLALGVVGSIMLGGVVDGAYSLKLAGQVKAIKQWDLIMAVIFSYIFFAGLFASFIASFKLKFGLSAALFSLTLGMLINMVLEFGLRILLTHFIDKIFWETAFVTAVAKLPSSILTAFITVVFGVSIYKLAYKATKQLNKTNNIEVEI